MFFIRCNYELWYLIVDQLAKVYLPHNVNVSVHAIQPLPLSFHFLFTSSQCFPCFLLNDDTILNVCMRAGQNASKVLCTDKKNENHEPYAGGVSQQGGFSSSLPLILLPFS